MSHEAQPLVTQLRVARKQRHLPGRVVARALHVSTATVYAWELGYREPPAGQLVRWADALGYTVHLAPTADGRYGVAA